MDADAGGHGCGRGILQVQLTIGLLFPPLACAHLMSAGLGAVHVREHDAVVLIGVPVSALTDADDDGDGLLQPSEIRAHRTEILQQLAAAFYLTVDGKVAVVREAHLMASVHAEDRLGAPQLEWWALLDFEPSVQGKGCTEVDLQWFSGIHSQGRDMVYTLQVQRAGVLHTAGFNQLQPRQSFGCTTDTEAGPR
jgi:hypothetical protein